MRLPKTSHRPSEPLNEVALGKGDYVAGGACSVPFLDLDGARRRRPLVFGMVCDDTSDCPQTILDMFSGRHSDPEEWAVMWKEIGADGVALDLRRDDPQLAVRIAERTRLPVAVIAECPALDALADYGDSRMLLIGRDGDHRGPCGNHAITVSSDTVDGLADKCLESESKGLRNIVILLKPIVLGEDLKKGIAFAEEIRRRALGGEKSLGYPMVCDVSSCWDRSFDDAREASIWEGESALAAMMAGADIILVRGPGAADMTRVYGEELADL